jgi:hypothetical protein
VAARRHRQAATAYYFNVWRNAGRTTAGGDMRAIGELGRNEQAASDRRRAGRQRAAAAWRIFALRRIKHRQRWRLLATSGCGRYGARSAAALSAKSGVARSCARAPPQHRLPWQQPLPATPRTALPRSSATLRANGTRHAS